MTNYQIKKEQARQQAIDWQLENSNNALSMQELATAGIYFEKLANRYGLKKEFHENGII